MKSRLPSDTVTFLFTDVEGSTRLPQQLGDEYADILAQHRRALREAFAQPHASGGIAEDQERQLGFRMLSTERQRYERLMAEARRRLGDAYDVENGSGAGLTLEQAVAEAEPRLRPDPTSA